MQDGTILGVGMDNKICTCENLNVNWVKAPDMRREMKGVAIMQDDTILGVDLNNKLCARADLYAKCVAARDAGGQVKGVAIMKDGIILGVGMDNKLYIRSLKSLKRPSEEATEKEAGALEEETVNPNLDLILIRSRRPVVSLLCKMVLFLVLA
jgi:hypothetical protein